MDQVITMMNTAVGKNLTNNIASMAGVVEQCKAHLVETVEDTVFYEPFNILSSFSQDVQDNLRADVIEAIASFVQPAFTNLVEFLESVFSINPCWDWSRRDSKGLEEVERIEDAMKEIVVEMGYEYMTLQNFNKIIRNNRTNFYNSADELLKAFHEIIENQIDSQLLMADGPAAFYTAGTPDGSRPGVLYVNTK